MVNWLRAAWDFRRATNWVIVSLSIWDSLENDILWTSLWVPLTATDLICARKLSSVVLSRVAAPMNSKGSLLTSLEQAALSFMRISSTDVMSVIVLYRRHESLKSSHSLSSMFASTVGRSGVLVFFLVVVCMWLPASPERNWVFYSCSFITCVICCCIRVSIDSICASVAMLLFWFFFSFCACVVVFEGDSLLLSGVSGFTDGRRAGGVLVDLASVSSVVLICVSW